jgi:hypothetical protein
MCEHAHVVNGVLREAGARSEQALHQGPVAQMPL